MSDVFQHMLAGVPDFEGALCAEVDPEIFFPEGQGAPARTAKAICQNCVAVVECLDYALANDIPAVFRRDSRLYLLPALLGSSAAAAATCGRTSRAPASTAGSPSTRRSPSTDRRPGPTS